MTIVCTPRRKATHRARGKTESVTCACQLSGVTPSTMSKRAASATTSQPRCDALGWLVVGPLALQVRRRLACISVSIGEIRGSILEIGRAGFGRRGGTRRGGLSRPPAPRRSARQMAHSQRRHAEGAPAGAQGAGTDPSPCRNPRFPRPHCGGLLVPSGNMISVFGNAARNSRREAAGILMQPSRSSICSPVSLFRTSTF